MRLSNTFPGVWRSCFAQALATQDVFKDSHTSLAGSRQQLPLRTRIKDRQKAVSFSTTMHTNSLQQTQTQSCFFFSFLFCCCCSSPARLWAAAYDASDLFSRLPFRSSIAVCVCLCFPPLTRPDKLPCGTFVVSISGPLSSFIKEAQIREKGDLAVTFYCHDHRNYL